MRIGLPSLQTLIGQITGDNESDPARPDRRRPAADNHFPAAKRPPEMQSGDDEENCPRDAHVRFCVHEKYVNF